MSQSSRPSIDATYFCPDLSDELEEESSRAIAGGSFSDVYKYKDRRADPPVLYAIKAFRYGAYRIDKQKTERHIKREVDSWRNLRHPNILRLEGVLYRPGCEIPCLVSPWMKNGTARQYLESTKNVKLLKFVSGIADGLLFMHQKTTAHGDLRGDNILVSASGQAKICDLGLSKIIESVVPGQTVTSVVGRGATNYRAPEYFVYNGPVKPTLPGDVWMFGMTLLELWSGQIPFSSCKREVDVVRMLLNHELPDVACISANQKQPHFGAYKERVLSICSLCWTIDPTLRPTMNTVAGLIRKEAADGLEHFDDSGIDLSEGLANLSMTESPRFMPRETRSVVSEGGSVSGASTYGLLDDVVLPYLSSPTPTRSSSSSSSLSSPSPRSDKSPPNFSSLWPNIPKPPSPMVDQMLQDASTGFKSLLNMYQTKKPVSIKYTSSPEGPDVINPLAWRVTCKVGVEYLGSASSRQKKMAEEQAAREAVQILKTRNTDYTLLTECVQYLPILRSHLAQHGLLHQVRFVDCPPNGPDHDRTFTCEVRYEENKLCEGYGLNKADAREHAARIFASAWRDGSL